MHPDPAFRFKDVAAMQAFAADRALAHIFAAAERPCVALAPVVVTPAGNLRFHLSRRNLATADMAGATAIASIAGPDGYVSPDWYESEDQVPTWNYVAVEAHGTVLPLSQADLVDQLDALSAAAEARLAPKPPWTRGKMRAGSFEAMLGGISGFELIVDEWRGTAKLSQNKRAADRQGVVAGFERIGRRDLAALVGNIG